MDEQGFAGCGILRTHLGDEVRLAQVHVTIDEVADDFDGRVDFEGGEGALAEVLGDGGDAVGDLDAEPGDGEVGAVEAHQGDVGTVEGGDEGDVHAAGGEHLAGEVRGDGVGDGVMDVQEVERVELGDFGHAGGEGEIVGRMLEERVVEDLDLVEVDVVLAAGEAERLRRGDEVDVMAAGRELDAELGGDNAGSAISRVAGYADAERFVGSCGAHPHPPFWCKVFNRCLLGPDLCFRCTVCGAYLPDRLMCG